MSAGSNIQLATGGFITFALSTLGMAIFVVWSLVPDSGLRAIGFTYYPNRYWAVAAPSIFTVLLGYFLLSNFIAYMRNTKALDDALTLTDSTSCVTRRGDGNAGGGVGHGSAAASPLDDANASVRPLADLPASVSSLVLHQPWIAG
jgi:hypothetical protein